MIAYIFNAYVYMYQLFHMHPMNMCYTYDCTHLYRLFCKCIQCICVYILIVLIVLQMHLMHMCIHMIAHICIDCFANASNAYVYTFDCTGSYRLLQMHLMNMFISIIAHIHIDCFAYASNAYVYTYDFTCVGSIVAYASSNA